MSNIATYYKENDNFYLNISMTNNPQITTHDVIVNPVVGIPYTVQVPNPTPPIVMSYDVTKTLPMLDDASQFYCAVLRFDIPLGSVPLFVMPIIPNQTDADLTPFIIGIEYNNVYYPVKVQYLPENDFVAPNQNVGLNKQVITPYYYVYSYETMIRMLNLSLYAAYTSSGVRAAITAANGGIEMMAPYFYYNPETQLISLIVNKYFTQVGAGFLASLPQIFINEPLLKYVDGFNLSAQTGATPKLNGADYIFTIAGSTHVNGYADYPQNNMAYTPYGYLVTPTNPPPYPDYFQFVQEYESFNYWSSIRKILLTTNTLPINREYEPAQGFDNGVNVSIPILTDFVPQIERAGEGRSIAYYEPNGQYRLVDMISTQPIYKVDINVYWQDTAGNIYPLYLSYGQQANIKLGFFRKLLYKNMSLLSRG